VDKESLTDLQLGVMKALWHLGGGTVADVAGSMARDGWDLAPTTVATLLQRLAKQGWVVCARGERPFVYRAKVDERQAAKGGVRRVLTSFFGGKASALTAHLLATEDLTREELEEMRRLVDAARKQR
jgi:BlaI family penicillinase repressor